MKTVENLKEEKKRMARTKENLKGEIISGEQGKIQAMADKVKLQTEHTQMIGKNETN